MADRRESQGPGMPGYQNTTSTETGSVNTGYLYMGSATSGDYIDPTLDITSKPPPSTVVYDEIRMAAGTSLPLTPGTSLPLTPGTSLPLTPGTSLPLTPHIAEPHTKSRPVCWYVMVNIAVVVVVGGAAGGLGWYFGSQSHTTGYIQGGMLVYIYIYITTLAIFHVKD